jgi:hypothetical protein
MVFIKYTFVASPGICLWPALLYVCGQPWYIFVASIAICLWAALVYISGQPCYIFSFSTLTILLAFSCFRSTIRIISWMPFSQVCYVGNYFRLPPMELSIVRFISTTAISLGLKSPLVSRSHKLARFRLTVSVINFQLPDVLYVKIKLLYLHYIAVSALYRCICIISFYLHYTAVSALYRCICIISLYLQYIAVSALNRCTCFILLYLHYIAVSALYRPICNI